MRNREHLFYEHDLDGQLRIRQEQVSRFVDGIPQGHFLVSSDNDLAEYVVASQIVEPIVLHEDAATMTQSETEVDISGDRMRVFSRDRSGPCYIPGTRVDIDIPFSGEDWIFRYRTNPWSSMLPRAEIQGGHLRISIKKPHDADPSSFKSIYEQEIALIREYVDRACKQVSRYNQNLPALAQQAVSRRRDRLARHGNIAAMLDIPLTERPGAPSINPVKIAVRRPPPLPVPPETGVAPEPGITDEAFEHILRFIRHQGRTFERTPGTFAVHSEEELRDIVLAHLNGHFQGDAVGEAFRGKGKTDICIEQDNRAAFVGECKIWTGASDLAAAMDQLLGYLTWRDSKNALIIFNTKNKDFTRILHVMPKALRDHPLFLRNVPCEEAGEWRVQLRSSQDEGRRVSVHVFLFDLYQDAEPRVRALQ